MNEVVNNEGNAYGRHGDFSAPLGDTTQGTLTLMRGIARASIQVAPEMPELYRAHFEGTVPSVEARNGDVTIRYPIFSPFDWAKYALYWGRQLAEITLNGAIPWQIDVRGGIADLRADLRELRLLALSVDGGASHVEVMLPRPDGVVAVRIGGGASNVTLRRPAGAAARVEIGHGASNLTFDDMRLGAIGGGSRWDSPDYRGATSRYEITIAGGASNLTIDSF